MPPPRPSIYPSTYPPNTRIIIKAPFTPLSKSDHVLVLLSSSFIIGSLLWVPLLSTWAYRKWKTTTDKKRRTIYGSFLLTLAAIVILWGPHRSPKVGDYLGVRKWRLWKAWMNYVAFEVLQDMDFGSERKLDVTKNDPAILAIIPHGLFPFSLGLAALPELAQEAFGRFRPVVATATAMFPVLRTILSWIGAVDASKSSVNHALSQGHRIGLSPGGIGEMFEGYPKPFSHPNDESTLLSFRKGFIRMAIQHNIPIIPVYCFGATKMFRRIPLPSFFENVSKLLRMSLVLFYGRWGFPIPFRQRLLYVMGRPIFAEEGEGVEEMHERFCEEMRRIFEKYKGYYGWDYKQFRIV